MFDIGGLELVLIGIVALIVMGDDFPTMFRKFGQFVGKMRKMAREFSRAMEEAADDAGVKDVSKTLRDAASPKSMGLDALNKAATNYEKWEAGTKRKPSAADAKADGAKPAPKPAAETSSAPAEKAAAEPTAPAQDAPAAPEKAPDPGP